MRVDTLQTANPVDEAWRIARDRHNLPDTYDARVSFYTGAHHGLDVALFTLKSDTGTARFMRFYDDLSAFILDRIDGP